MADITEADVDAAVARAFGHEPRAAEPAGVAEGSPRTPGEVSEADVDRAVARAFGRVYAPRAKAPTALDKIVESLTRDTRGPRPQTTIPSGVSHIVQEGRR